MLGVHAQEQEEPMLCKEIMKPGVEVLAPSSTALLAAQKMRDLNVGFLPVCDASKKVLGTVTDRDLTVRIIAEDRPVSMPVSELMTGPVISCHPEDDIRTVQRLMSQHHKSRIVVADSEGRVVGIISLSDIARYVEPIGAAETMKKVSEREARVT
jgi:CBS domain-containing protein